MNYTAKNTPSVKASQIYFNLLLNISPSKEAGLLIVYTVNEIWCWFLTKRYTAPTAPQLIQAEQSKTKTIPEKKVDLFWDPYFSICFFWGENIARQCAEILHRTISNLAPARFITIKAGTAAALRSWHKPHKSQNSYNRRSRENLRSCRS